MHISNILFAHCLVGGGSLGTMPGCAQGLFLFLCSSVTPNGTRKIKSDASDWTQVFHMQGKQVSCPLYYLYGPAHFLGPFVIRTKYVLVPTIVILSETICLVLGPKQRSPGKLHLPLPMGMATILQWIPHQSKPVMNYEESLLTINAQWMSSINKQKSLCCLKSALILG